MLILQFQFTNVRDDELNIIPEFIEWISDQIFQYINTSINRKKIQLRINYLYQVKWIDWINTRYIDTQSIMEAIYDSFTYKQRKDNTWIIEIDNNIRIPNTYASIGKLIRFLNSGDINLKGTGMFTAASKHFNHKKLNNLWQIFAMRTLGSMTKVKIIAE